MNERKLFGYVTVGTKGQIVIPAEVREALEIKPGDHLFVIGGSKKMVSLIPEAAAQKFIDELNQHVEDFQALRDVSKAIEATPITKGDTQ